MPVNIQVIGGFFFFFLQKPDIGVELTGGCKGFATKYMDWSEELIVGGSVKNRSRIIRRYVFFPDIMNNFLVVERKIIKVIFLINLKIRNS